MENKWKIIPRQFNDLIKQLLFNRSIKTKKEIEIFFQPKLIHFEKDFKIPGIEKAKKRIMEAIKKEELIMVFGDYDADGICSLAIMYHLISALGGKFLPYIPHREKEGYGLSEMGLNFAKEKGAGLVITVDNGIVAFEQAKYAKSLGLDLIITDHHLAQKKLPEAFAIVHSTSFCGAGVAWCLARAMLDEKEANDLLDLVAIATVCDLSPLLSANRCLVKLGLEKLNRTDRMGLIVLFKEAGLVKGEIDAYSIGHIIGPRLNALGRLEHAIDSLRLLCTKEPVKARLIAKKLSQVNEEKKQLTISAIDEAKEIIKQIEAKKKIIIVYSDSWIPGIMGLVAGRLVEEYNLPSIAISITDGMAKGSARSVEGINIVEAIRKCREYLIDVGGHPKAAGFSMEKEKIGEFKKKMEEIMEDYNIDKSFGLQIEAEIKIEEINRSLVGKLLDFEPTGVDNPRPILATRSVEISNIRTVGEGKHLKFKTGNLDVIAFNKGDLAGRLIKSPKVDLAFTLNIDTFNGSEKIQLKTCDLRFN